MDRINEQILDICQILSEQQQLQVTIKEAAKGFLIAGTGAALGTLLGGPLGLFIGGTLGSATGAIICKDKCKSVVEVIKYDMTTAQRRTLVIKVRNVLESAIPEDIIFLLPMVLSSESLRDAALREIVEFITNEMGMAITTN